MLLKFMAIGTLFPNIDLSTYYMKTEIGTLFSNIDINLLFISEVDDIATIILQL